MHSENQVRSLRKLYNKTLWTYVGVAALSVAATAFLVVGNMVNSDQALYWLIAAWIGLALAAVEYIIERALYKKGKKGAFLLTGFLLGLMLLYVILAQTGLIGDLLLLFYPLLLGFLISRPLIPAISLLRDAGALRDGNLNETVGKVKAGTRRKSAEVGRDSYLLFEDELTHEILLLRMSNVSPLHRYRVFYLPHSGLAVGEVIPDNITFDPFGNPVEREVEDTEPTSDKPKYTEESYTAKPDYKEEEPAEKPWYQNPEAFSSDPSKAEPKERDTMPDPNSPERQKAAKLKVAEKIIQITSICLIVGGMILAFALQNAGGSPAVMLMFFLPGIALMFLSAYFQNRRLKLVCTMRTTAFCVDTVRRRSGKTTTRHPIVEYEVDGVTLTAELSVNCSRDAVGDLYTIYYDPLDPDTVRPERRGLFD